MQPHLTILDVGALCARILAMAGTLRQGVEGSTETAQEGEQQDQDASAELARLLANAVRTLERRGDRMPFDAIMVDEAQDVDPPLWPPLQRLLRDHEGGLLYIFFDEAQRDGEGSWRVPLAGEKALLPLVVNLRNTRAIFDVMMRFYTGPDAPVCRGPEGRPPMYLDPAMLGEGVVGAGDGRSQNAQRMGGGRIWWRGWAFAEHRDGWGGPLGGEGEVAKMPTEGALPLIARWWRCAWRSTISWMRRASCRKISWSSPAARSAAAVGTRSSTARSARTG